MMKDMDKMVDDEFPCTECDKKFRSWKALFGHMRCHPDRLHRGMQNYFRRPRPEVDEPSTSTATTMMTDEDYEVADCLLMLANGAFDHSSGPSAAAATATTNIIIKNGDDDRGKGKMILMSSSSLVRHKCSKCLRVFSSGQALGGHKRSCLHHHYKHHLGFDLNSCPLLLNVQGIDDDSNYSGLDLELRLGVL